MTIHLCRVHDDVVVGRSRVLIDRLWPRGVSKADAALDLWARDVAPSDGLRRWFHADRSRFDVFASRYRAELESEACREMLLRIVSLARRGDVALLTAASDVERSHAPVLEDVLLAGQPTRGEQPCGTTWRTH